MDAEDGLRTVSDELLSELDRLAAIEAEKRTLHPGDERAAQLSAQGRELAERILATSRVEQRLAEEGLQAAREARPGAPDHSIEETPRALHSILDDWRSAERQATAAASAAERAEFRLRAQEFRDEYARALERIKRREGDGEKR
jgi:hypothetical protein